MDGQGDIDEFDRVAAELQEQINRQVRALYSQKVIEEVNHPRNVGRMSEPNACAVVRGWCGDTMKIYLRLKEDKIEEATFFTDGCGPTVACGSMLTTLVTGASLEEAAKIGLLDLIDALNGLPDDSLHCAELAVSTLRQALTNGAGIEVKSEV